jgi:hypothetical protein
MTKRELVASIAFVLTGASISGSALAAQSFAYPPAGRTPDQQRQDQYECHQWAVEQSHYDPSQAASQGQGNAAVTAPARSPGDAAVGGAARGAAVAKVADDDTNDGAKAGAALGLIRQRRAQASAAYENAQAQKAAQEQQRELQAKRQAYDAARNTCYKARGYTVSEG